MRPAALAAAVAALAVSACDPVPPASNADLATLTPRTLGPVAAGYLTPDPNYIVSGNPGDISCNAIVQSGSTGPMYQAVRYGLSEWDDFMRDNRNVLPPNDANTRELAQFIADFCQDTPVAVVRDPVYAFLSYRPGSVASSFGDTEVQREASTGPDPILDSARVTTLAPASIPAAPAGPTFNPDPLALRPLRPGVVVPGTR